MLNFQILPTDEQITPQAGLALVGEVFTNLGLGDLLDRYLPPPGSATGYKPSQFVLPLALMQIGGGEALTHTRQLAADTCLLKLLGVPHLPDPGTIGDWLRRTYAKGYEGLQTVNTALNRLILAADGHTDYTFDPDATAIESEKASSKMTYKGFTGYMPMLGLLAEVPVVLVDDFRDGNVSPQVGILATIRQARAAMPAGKRIGYMRSDSAGYQAAVINECLQEKIIFGITADRDVAVRETIATIQQWQRVVDKHGQPTDREWGEAVHTMNKMKEGFRLIVQRWEDPQRPEDLFGKHYCYHAIASNHKGTGPEVIAWHNQRANSENYNKEIKLGFGLEHLPSNDFGANAMYFRIGILAYNLLIAMKWLVFPVEWRQKTIKTLRWVWIHTAGKLIRHGRRWTLKLAGLSAEAWIYWRDIRLRCLQLS